MSSRAVRIRMSRLQMARREYMHVELREFRFAPPLHVDMELEALYLRKQMILLVHTFGQNRVSVPISILPTDLLQSSFCPRDYLLYVRRASRTFGAASCPAALGMTFCNPMRGSRARNRWRGVLGEKFGELFLIQRRRAFTSYGEIFAS